MEHQENENLARPGAIHYMDAPALRRGMHIPASIRTGIAAIGLAALAIASIFGLSIYHNIVNAPEQFAESVEEAIDSGPGLELLVLNNFVGVESDSIRSTIEDSGLQTIDVNVLFDEDASEGDIDLVKIPSDMSYDKAEDLFKKSLRRATVTDAAHYLAGSWRLTSTGGEGVDLKVKYADMHSDSIDEAIATAIAAQGWSDSTFGESGVDQSQNTFQSGTIDINETTYRWTVSACPLDEVYSINGLPDNAFYIGARLFS